MDRDQVLSKVRERILIYATSRLGRDAAEDLAQDAMILLTTKYAHIEVIGDLVPLGIRTMQYLMHSHRRGQRNHENMDDLSLSDPSPNPETSARYKFLQERLMTVIGTLGDRCKRIFLLKLDGYNFEEIRLKLGAKSINTVYVWDFRCRRSLRELVGEEVSV
jgi:RNA polymerase sigma-70 factor, ECF subfamily